MSRLKKHSSVFYVVFIFFCLYALTLILPFLWAIMTTFKTEEEFINNKTYFPEVIDWTNYIDAFRQLSSNNTNMFEMIFNSIWWSVGGTCLAIISSTMGAYVVVKYKFFGRQIIYSVAIITMMLPIIGAMPSQYTVYSALGILNNPGMLLAAAGGFGFNFIVLYGFFRSLPWDYVEATFLDGGGHYTAMFRVMLLQYADRIFGKLSDIGIRIISLSECDNAAFCGYSFAVCRSFDECNSGSCVVCNFSEIDYEYFFRRRIKRVR